jgi:hypothetical protein
MVDHSVGQRADLKVVWRVDSKGDCLVDLKAVLMAVKTVVPKDLLDNWLVDL